MKQYLKYIMTGVLSMASSATAFSMDIICRQLVQSGNTMDISEPVMSQEPIKISLANPSMQGTWIVENLNYYGEYETVMTSTNTGDALRIDPENIDWRRPYRDEISPRHRAYVLRISFYTDDNSCDSVDIRWVLLPDKPEISIVSFIFEYNWEEDCIWPDGILGINVNSAKMESCCLWASEAFLFEPPKIFKCGFPYEVDSSDSTYLEYDAEWGEYIAIEAINKYGTIYGDKICTTDYIDDPDVLARIEEIRLEQSVGSVSSETTSPSFKFHDNAIHFMTTPKNTLIYDMSGRIVYSGFGETRIDMSDVPSGLYILSYHTEINLYQTKFLRP